jgi:ribosomal protein S18 acetylase RimI-like enzyme
MVKIDSNERLIKEMEIEAEFLEKSESAVIISMGVAQPFRKIGIGSLLLKKLVGELEKNHPNCIVLYTDE